MSETQESPQGYDLWAYERLVENTGIIVAVHQEPFHKFLDHLGERAADALLAGLTRRTMGQNRRIALYLPPMETVRQFRMDLYMQGNVRLVIDANFLYEHGPRLVGGIMLEARYDEETHSHIFEVSSHT